MNKNIGVLLSLAGALALSPPQSSDSPALPPIDYRSLVAKADLVYDTPVARSEEGLPLGNGRMGSLVWTTPAALKFQINRVDLQPINRDTDSFFERNTDYMGGCGFVDVELAGAGADVFPASGTTQHLSIYDALLDLKGRGVSARMLAWHAKDVMAIELDDRRAAPEPIQVNLRMLRFASQNFGGELEKMIADHVNTVRTRNHTASSQLLVRDGRIILRQEFREGAYVAKSAVAIAMVGRQATARFADETELRLVAPAARGRALILIASAATLDANEDVVASALGQLDAAVLKTFAGLASDNAAWWRAFWERGALALHSADGVADYVAENYHYYLYLMAATSRGKFPPKFNGMIWNTAGDLRTWGAQHWFANLSCYYEALFAANRLDLLDPVFSMYSGMFDASATAARQQWGSEGIYIPETVWFDGLATLPDDIAAEMRELYLLRKPWDQRSPRFMEFAQTKLPHSSRWNWFGGGSWVAGRWVPTERGFGPYGPVTHILGTTAKVAYLYWRRYEYTLDETWLRERAYPMLKGAAEFYRTFPNVWKGDDGKYHIRHVNSNESVMGATDTDEDLSAMRGVFAAAIRAGDILGVDPSLRAQWRDRLENLAPIPTSDLPGALRPDDYTGPRVFVRGLKPVANGRGFTPDGNSLPMWFFDLVNLESTDAALLAAANATFDRSYATGIGASTSVGVLSKMAIAGTTLGRADATRFLVPNQLRTLSAERQTAYRGGQVLANRMTLREGPQALDAQRLGRAAEALQLALLQSFPPAPAGEPIMRLFPAWPAEWDADFTLRARGGFVVRSSRRGGQVAFVELRSTARATARLRNPWGTAPVTLYRNGQRWQRLEGNLLTFETAPGDVVVAVRS
jgi:glycosyl hydrolase family 95